MAIVAIIGAGPLGGAVAHTLAARSRVNEVRLIDPHGQIAAGKALDIQQSAPVERFSTRVSAATDYGAAAGADAIVFADLAAAGAEIAGEPGLTLLRQMARLDTNAPWLFAGGAQRDLMVLAIDELHVPVRRLLGSAPFALESAVRAITAALIDASRRRPLDWCGRAFRRARWSSAGRRPPPSTNRCSVCLRRITWPRLPRSSRRSGRRPPTPWRAPPLASPKP